MHLTRLYIKITVALMFGVGLTIGSSVRAADVTAAPDNEFCSPGTTFEDSPNLILNGDFATVHGGSATAGEVIAGSFTATIPYVGDDIYAPDTSISIQQGPADYFDGLVVQETFPGDAEFGIPAMETFLYSNGNNTGGAYSAWIQTVEVEPSTEYLFVAYLSNMILAGRPQRDDPIVGFRADGERLSDTYTVLDETVESGDVWIRVSRRLTTRDDQTSVTLSLVDNANGANGDDLALTAIRLRACVVANAAPQANDDSATTEDSTPVLIEVLANDSDPDGDTVAVESIVQMPLNGSATIGEDGQIEYSPQEGFTGEDSFVYQIIDADGQTATATVTITVTARPDFDGDGIPDVIDIDDDNDGIPDAVEGTEDFDGDGQPNSQDLDADGDGITDLEESGINDEQQSALDQDGDGQYDDDVPVGSNGLVDDLETAPDAGDTDYDNDGTGDDPINHDGDTQPDYLDLDSDNDSIPDVIEAGLEDADQDAQADPGQPLTSSPPDTDGDGILDVHDLDDDNDGLTDAEEAGSQDADGDGIVDGFTDADMDGYDDATALNPAPLPDNDGDGIVEYLDPRSPEGGGGGTVDPPACDCRLETGLDGHGGAMGGLIGIVLAAMAIGRWVATRKLRLSAVVAIAVSCLSVPVFADVDDALPKRFYAGVHAGLSNIEPSSPCGCYNVNDDEDTALGLHVGWDFNPLLSFEAHYLDSGEAEIAFRSSGADAGSVGYEHLGASVLVHALRWGDSTRYDHGFSAYGRFGVSRMDNDTRLDIDQDHETQLHLGAGVEYRWNEFYSVRAEVLSFDDDSQAYLLGLSRRFGARAEPAQRQAVTPQVEEKEEFAALEVEPVTPTPISVPTIYFDFDSNRIGATEIQKLQQFVDALNQRPSDLDLTGHTDSVGSAAYNQLLSQRRAQAIADYLRRNGLDETEIGVSGAGESAPVADNATAEGRALNRRVEIELRELSE